MQSPIVSVCIPAYNGERFIKYAIASVLTQTFTDWELIICDDCSNDNTAKIVDSFSDSRIRFYINPKNLGISANFNRCIEFSKGNYIYIFAQDDVMCSTNLEKKVKLLNENPKVGMVYSNAYKIDEKGEIVCKYWAGVHDEDFVQDGSSYLKSSLFRNNAICCPTVMVRKECYNKVGGYDLRLTFTLDFEMWMRIALHYNIAYLSEPLIYYRRHSDNYTHKHTKNLGGIKEDYLARKIVIEKNLEKFENVNSLFKEIKRCISNISLDRAINYYNTDFNMLALKHLYFAFKIYPPIFKKWLFKRLLIKILFGTKGVNLFRKLKIILNKISI